MATGRIDIFHRPESKKFSREAPLNEYFFPYACSEEELEEYGPVELLALILEEAYSQGIPRGSFRGGAVEVQSDIGIWTSSDGNRLDPWKREGKIVFKTWAQMEAEES